MIFLNLFSFFFILLSLNASAECERRSVEPFSGQFRLTEIEKVQTQCLFDENGVPHPNQPIKVDQKGCVITIELIKVTKGIQPKENGSATSLYRIYDSGPKCKMKIGTMMTKKIEFTGFECCAEYEKSLRSKVQFCSLKPELRLIEQPTEKYIRCSSKGAGWKIIEGK